MLIWVRVGTTGSAVESSDRRRMYCRLQKETMSRSGYLGAPRMVACDKCMFGDRRLHLFLGHGCADLMSEQERNRAEWCFVQCRNMSLLPCACWHARDSQSVARSGWVMCTVLSQTWVCSHAFLLHTRGLVFAPGAIPAG